MTKPSMIFDKLDAASLDTLYKIAAGLTLVIVAAATIYTKSLAVGIIITIVVMIALAIAAPIIAFVLYGIYRLLKLIKL